MRDMLSSLRGRSRWVVLGGSVALGVLTIAACVGDEPATPGASSGAPPADGGGPGVDGDGSEPDGGGCAAATCADPSTLKKCDGTTETCKFACVSEGTAHCTIIHPSGDALTAADLAPPGALDVTLMSTAFVTDTGAIEGVRAPNADPLKMEVKDGIGFRLGAIDATHKIGVWTFKSLTVPAGATVRFSSTYAAALVATTTIEIAGVVDARGYATTGELCGRPPAATPWVPGPGGGAGGTAVAPASGPGAGLPANPSTYYNGGPSGAGHAARGGAGGPGNNAATQRGGDAGASYGIATLLPLLGGSGGGGNAFSGGGGGGALHVVAGDRVIVGGAAAPGGINAGGCGGVSGSMGGAGGGGGSGGAILIETPTLEMRTNGVLAANGGAGGGAASGGDGQPGQLGDTVALPGSTTGYGFSGSGAARTSATGSSAGSAPSTSTSGGAGGGAAGRIRINNRSGSYTVPSGATISPSLTIVSDPPSTVGTLDVR